MDTKTNWRDVAFKALWTALPPLWAWPSPT